jgi:hypothetical protein
MHTKDIAKNIIDHLPDESTLDDIIHALYVKAKFEHGEIQIKDGQGLSHEEAKIRLQKWQS